MSLDNNVKDFEELNKFNKPAMKLITKWFIFFGVLALVSAGTVLILKPAKLGFERKVFVASHQYQEAHNTAIAILLEKKAELAVKAAETQEPDVRAALRAQIAALQRRIDVEERKLNQ